MAESKKSSTKKITDVEHPDKTAPSDTSKPVIVTNRAILKDPMMADESKDPSAAEAEEPTKITVKTSTKPIIKPLEETDKQSTESTSEDKADPSRTIAELAAQADAAKPQTETETATEPDSEAKDDSADEKPAEEQDSGEEKAETPADGKSPAQTPKEAEQEAAAAKKHDEEMQALVDSKKYFLPINSVEQRKSKRFIALGILLSLVLALAWLDVALDAGLIEAGGVKPLTHFFSN